MQDSFINEEIGLWISPSTKKQRFCNNFKYRYVNPDRIALTAIKASAFAGTFLLGAVPFLIFGTGPDKLVNNNFSPITDRVQLSALMAGAGSWLGVLAGTGLKFPYCEGGLAKIARQLAERYNERVFNRRMKWSQEEYENANQISIYNANTL